MRRIRIKRFFWPIMGLLAAAAVLLAFKSNLPGIGRTRMGTIIRPPHEVSALAVKDGTIFAGGQEGVFMIDCRSRQVRGKLGEDQGFEYVRDLLVDRQGVLWIAHNQGLTSYDGRRFVTFTDKDGLPDKRVNCLYEDSQGRLWAGTWGGAAWRENGHWKIMDHKSGLITDMVNVILEDRRGGIWFGSYAIPAGGVSYYDGSVWKYLTYKNQGLPDPNISDIFEDSTGQILIASGFVDRGGLVRIKMDGSKIKSTSIQSRKDGLAGEKVRSLFEDAEGGLWVASEYDGVARFSKGGSSIYTRDNGLSGNEVKTWLLDEAGNLWMGTNDGITFIRSDELEKL